MSTKKVKRDEQEFSPNVLVFIPSLVIGVNVLGALRRGLDSGTLHAVTGSSSSVRRTTAAASMGPIICQESLGTDPTSLRGKRRKN
jgi:hypothetical protein